MNNHAEELDYWNDNSSVSILKLDVLPLQAQQAPGDGQAAIGRLFTAVAGLTSGNGEDIKAVITGYLRKQTTRYETYQWQPEDVYAPRNHNNGIPPVRLLTYPEQLTSDTGGRIPALDLSRLIAGQLGKDDGWRAQIVEQIEAARPEDMCYALKIPYEPADTEPDSTESSTEPDIDLELDDAEPEAHDESEVPAAPKESDNPEPEAVGLDADDDWDIDLDSETPEMESPDGKAVAEAEEDEDMASLIDEWDEEDETADNLAALANEPQIENEIDDLVELDGGDDLQEPDLEPNTFDKRNAVASTFAWDQPAATSEPTESLVNEQSADDLNIPEDNPESSTAPDTVAASTSTTAPTTPATTRPTLSAVPTQREPAEPTTEAEKVAKECVLFNEDGYDIGFYGFEHGSMAISNGTGDAGTLYTTKGGNTVVHVDGCRVREISQDNKDELFKMMGYSREAKKLYKKANLNCVRWLD